MLMENGVENEPILDSNQSMDAGSDNKMKDLDENDKFEETVVDQESFYEPVIRHVASDSKDSQDLVFEEAINPENFDVLDDKIDNFEPELNSAETNDEIQPVIDLIDAENTRETELILSGVDANEGKQLDVDLIAVGNTEEFKLKLNGMEMDDVLSSEIATVMGDDDKEMLGNENEETVENISSEETHEVENVLLAACDDFSVETVTESNHLVNPIVTENDENGLDEAKSVNANYNCITENITESEYHEDHVILETCVEKLSEEEPPKEESYFDQLVQGTTIASEEHNPSNEAAKDAHASNSHDLIQPSSAISETDNGIIANSRSSVVNKGISSLEQTKADLSNSVSKENFGVIPALVKSASEYVSNKDDEIKKIPSSPSPAPAPWENTASRPESNGSLNLPPRPAGLGSSAPLPEPASRPIQQNRANSVAPQRQPQSTEESTNGNANDESEENDETREKLQMIRVKFLRLTHRLGQTPHNVVVAQVLYRLGLAEHIRRNTNSPGVFSFDRASVMAEKIEAAGIEPLDFSCTILVIGKTGVGKSATINSIFDAHRNQTDAFQVSTKKVQDFVGPVQGIKVRIIDTPGLYPSSSDQWQNEKILRSVKKFISKSPPDIVLYFDRLDMQSRDYGDVPLLKSITNVFGSSIWFNAIIVLTHAASAPPDGPNGTPLSYEMFVSQRSHVVQQAIRQAAQDIRLMNPVSLVENHSACRTNRAGQRVLPNGQVWKPHLLLLSFASKILAEANTLLQLQEAPVGRPRARSPPLPYFLSSLLHSRAPLKLPEEQYGDDFTVDDDLDSSDLEDETEYDDLPPFRTLSKSQLDKLSKLQKKAYFEELEYREKLFFRKQLKEEIIRRKLMKKMSEAVKDLPQGGDAENIEGENSQASVPVAMPDLPLPSSFDSDNPTHRYRALDTSSQWIVRPVLENHVWDHDVGYDGLNVERLFAIRNKVPFSFSGQLTKDKKECTFQAELASSLKHGDAGTTTVGLDMQTVGKDMSYTLRGETRVKSFRRNSTVAGVSVTHLADTISAGVKVEDSLIVNKRFKMLMSGGAMTGKGDIAYGARLEATSRDRDYPIGRNMSTIAFNVVDWHGDTSVVCNMQSQIPIGRGSNVIGHANYNNKGSGQVGLRFNTTDQLQIALLALLPLFRHVKRALFDSSEMMD